MIQPKVSARRLSQGMSIRPIDRKALVYLASLDSHDSISAAARKLIDQRMRAEIGSDWEQVLLTRRVHDEEAVA